MKTMTVLEARNNLTATSASGSCTTSWRRSPHRPAPHRRGADGRAGPGIGHGPGYDPCNVVGARWRT